MPEQEIGTVVHFFGGPSVAIIKLTAGELAVGDTVRFHGHTTDFTEAVSSMEVNHQQVSRAAVGEEVAVKVVSRARPHDK
ncbi:MAG: translation elongation factor-like protein, partial [Gemmatimonadales bacterium]